MTIKQFIQEFKLENETYYSSGLVDDISVYRWVINALKPLGNHITEKYDAIIEVKNNKAYLPENFYTIESVYLCEPDKVICKKGEVGILEKSSMWTERVQRSQKWNICEGCCDEGENKVIQETVYINDNIFKFIYKQPKLLKLGKHINKSSISSSCVNQFRTNSPYEFTIKNNTIFTNFKEGSIYVYFNGLLLDEEGEMVIPDFGLGNVEQYVWTYVYKEFYEKLLRNKQDQNIITLFQYYAGQLDLKKGSALTEAKMSAITPDVMKKIAYLNRKDMMRYEINFPKI